MLDPAMFTTYGLGNTVIIFNVSITTLQEVNNLTVVL